MSDMEAYLGNKILRWLKGTAMPLPPAGLFVALFDGDPRELGSGEVSALTTEGGRVEATFDAVAEGDDNNMQNSAPIDFGTAGSEFDVTHIAVFDAATDGNRLFSKALTTPQSLTIGTPIVFPSGTMVFELGTPSDEIT